MNAMTCSCGCATVHVVARRLTADGISIALHSDGAVTGRFHALQGVPVARPRTPEAQSIALAAGWMFVHEVEMYDLAEVPALYAACRWAAARGLDRSATLARLGSEKPLALAWTITKADNRGNTVERECALNRVQWPGLTVLHNARGYHVLSRELRAATGQRAAYVLVPTGVVFQTQRELCSYLRDVSTFNTKATS